jgi:hypothetical protein
MHVDGLLQTTRMQVVLQGDSRAADHRNRGQDAGQRFPGLPTELTVNQLFLGSLAIDLPTLFFLIPQGRHQRPALPACGIVITVPGGNIGCGARAMEYPTTQPIAPMVSARAATTAAKPFGVPKRPASS